jgi:hypothetical protein
LAPQEHDVPRSVVGVTSSEIQEVGEGSGASLLPELEEEGAQITNLVRSTWASSYEVDVCNTLILLKIWLY